MRAGEVVDDLHLVQLLELAELEGPPPVHVEVGPLRARAAVDGASRRCFTSHARHI